MKKETTYIRLLSYDNACKVIDFINENDEEDYANITTGGVAMQVSEKNFIKVNEFLTGLNVRYEISNIPPYKVVEGIITNLKKNNII